MQINYDLKRRILIAMSLIYFLTSAIVCYINWTMMDYTLEEMNQGKTPEQIKNNKVKF